LRLKRGCPPAKTCGNGRRAQWQRFTYPNPVERKRHETPSRHSPEDAVSVKTRAQVGEELAAAQQSGNWMINSKLGTVSRQITAQSTGKSREQVRSELEQAYRGGGAFANAELS
jgi:hypothetical protein